MEKFGKITVYEYNIYILAVDLGKAESWKPLITILYNNRIPKLNLFSFNSIYFIILSVSNLCRIIKYFR